MKNSLNGIYSQFDIAETNINELDDLMKKILQNKAENTKKRNRPSVTYWKKLSIDIWESCLNALQLE